MSTLVEYLRCMLKVRRSLLEKLGNGSDYSRGYLKGIEDTLKDINDHEDLELKQSGR